MLEITDAASFFQKKIPRRIFVKSLAGAGLVVSSSMGCAPFSSPMPPLGKLLVTYQGHQWYRDGRIWTVAWSPDSMRIASSTDRDIQIWNASDGSHILTYHHQTGDLAWSPDGKRIVSVDSSPTISIWDTATGKNVLVYQVLSYDTQHDTAVVTVIAWSPDGKRIVSGGYFDHTVVSDSEISSTNYDQMQVWDAITGKVIHRNPTDSLFGVLWSPDGTKIAARGFDIEVVDASTFSSIATCDTQKVLGTAPNTAVWSPDSQNIASAGYGNNVVCIWNAISGNIVTKLTTLDNVYSLTWSPDGKHLALSYGFTQSGQEVQIVDAQTGKPTYTYHSQFSVTHIAWSPDGTRVACGGMKQEARFLVVEVIQAS